MTKTEFVAVFVRLAGIALMLVGMGGLPLMVMAISRATAATPMAEYGAIWLLLLSQLAWVLAAGAVIAFPHLVAGWFLGRHAQQPLAFQWTHGAIEGIGFSLLGLWCVVEAFRGIAYSMAYIVAAHTVARSLDIGTVPLDSREVANAVMDAVTLIIGIWLLVGAQGLRSWLGWARGTGAATPGEADAGP